MKNCTFHETGKDTIDIDDLNSKLKEYFNEAFVEKIKEIEKNFNLLTYDLIQILDYNQAEFNLSYNYIDYFKMKKIKTK